MGWREGARGRVLGEASPVRGIRAIWRGAGENRRAPLRIKGRVVRRRKPRPGRAAEVASARFAARRTESSARHRSDRSRRAMWPSRTGDGTCAQGVVACRAEREPSARGGGGSARSGLLEPLACSVLTGFPRACGAATHAHTSRPPSSPGWCGGGRPGRSGRAGGSRAVDVQKEVAPRGAAA